jgi:hypothetical protein
VDIEDVLSFIESEINFIFDHEESFMKHFAKGEAEDLVDVSFDYVCLHITYIIKSGQHFCDAVLMIDYLRWRDGIKSNIK